jgi:hypothetical protein
MKKQPRTIQAVPDRDRIMDVMRDNPNGLRAELERIRAEERAKTLEECAKLERALAAEREKVRLLEDANRKIGRQLLDHSEALNVQGEQLVAEREKVRILREALNGIAPMVGWGGSEPEDLCDDPERSILRCEYCRGTDEGSPNEVKHSKGCPVPAIHAALAATEPSATPRSVTPTDNNDIRHEAQGNLAFLLSVIRCGEQLSDDEEANVRRVIAELGKSCKPEWIETTIGGSE